MRAAVIEGPNELTVRDLPEPDIGPYQARCELLYGAVCAGTDRHLVAGDEPFKHWFACPAILGHESIGRVVEVGPKVRHLRCGDLVTRVGCPPVGGVHSAWGGFAEQGVATDWRAMRDDGLPTSDWNDARVQQVLPETVDPAAATMFITWRETLSYALRVGVTAGKRLLVIGSGGNGLAFVNHAKFLGATAVMLGSAARRELAERAGAEASIAYNDADAATGAKALASEGFDCVIDVVGTTATAELGLSLLADGGTIGIYGMDGGGRCRLDPSLARGAFRVQPNAYDEAETHEEVLANYLAGRLDASIWLDLDRPYELADIGLAFKTVASRQQVKPLIQLQRV